MLRKIFKSNNSLVVSLPQQMLDLLGIVEGAYVHIELDIGKRQILLRPIGKHFDIGVDEKFARKLAEFIEEYRPALEALSRR